MSAFGIGLLIYIFVCAATSVPKKQKRNDHRGNWTQIAFAAILILALLKVL